MKNVIYVKTSCLQENPLTSTLYSVDRDIDNLIESVRNEGIQEPLIVRSINNSNTLFEVLSGVRRLRVAKQLNIQEVPVILKSFTDEQVNKGLIITFNQQRVKCDSEILKELRVIKQRYGLKQGVRSKDNDKVSKGRKLKKNLVKTYNKTKVDKLGTILNLLDEISDGDESKWEQEVKKVDKGSINGSLNRLKDLVKEKENRSVVPLINEINTPDVQIYNQDMSNLSQLKDESVQTIMTSPPYFNMRDYENGDGLIDTETDMDLYALKLAKMFDDCKRVLKFRGSMFVNLADRVDKGEYQLVAFEFASKMKKRGWILADSITWIKNNAQYTSSKGSNTMHEFILHFVKTPQYYNDKEWLNKEGVLPTEFIYGVGKKQPKLKSVIDYRHPTVTTNVANNHGLRKECEKRGLNLTHSATYPLEIPLIGIMSTSKPGDIVLDTFSGTATTGQVAIANGRKYVGYELNTTYIEISKVRLGIYDDEVKIAA